jgi:hypothetical protein
MALQSTQTLVDAGTAPTFAAAAATDTLTYSSGLFVVYKNTNAATRTVTITVPGNTTYGQALPDPVLTLGATTGELWIPMRSIYRDSTTGLVTVAVSVITNVTIAVVRLV